VATWMVSPISEKTRYQWQG